MPKSRVGPHALAAACLAMAVVAPRVAAGFEVRHTTSGTPVRWQTAEVSLEIDPSLVAAVPGALPAVLTSVSAWALAASSPSVSVTIATTASSPAVDGHNVVYFMPDGYPEAGEALAITLVSFDDSTGEIVDADIVINGRYRFAVLPADSTPTLYDVPVANDPDGRAGALYAAGGEGPFDLVHVVAHETGHLLGLLDAVGKPTDLMFVYTSPHDASRRAPAPDDVAGVEALYREGAITSSQGCAAARVVRAPGVAWLLPLAAVAGFALRRSRASSTSRRAG